MASQSFSYTGAEVTWVVPVGVTSVAVDMAGGQGGSSTGTAATAAKGGRVQATLTVTPGETLRIGVGGKGVDGVSGTPGAGGFYQGAPASTNNVNYGGGGAGQSYLKRGGAADSNRVVVAAGGGGVGGAAADNTRHGGIVFDTEAVAATTPTAGEAGTNCGGGGGGWRGGFGGIGGSTDFNRHGYGGSNMAHSTQTSGVTSTTGYQTGDGYVTLTWTGVDSTRNQTFYMGGSADDQTFSSEATIRALQESAPAATNGTIVRWTTTTVTEKTVIPLVDNSTAGDTSMNNGWAFKNDGDEGLGSSAFAQRWFKAGVWSFSLAFTVDNPALLDTHAITFTAKVYRVAAGGGARTLLFTATSANQTASATVTWNSASQPEIVLEAGEVIMVGLTSTSASTTALVLGANSNTIVRIPLGSNFFVSVPSPGVRTLSIGAYSAASVATATAKGNGIFSGVFTASGLATAQVVATGVFSGVFNANALAAVAAVGASRASTVFSASGIATAQAIGTGIFSGAFTAAGAATAQTVGAWTFSGVFSASGLAASDWDGGAYFSGVFSAAGVATPDWQMSAVAGTVFSAAGVATPDWRVTNIFSGVFAAAGAADSDFHATAIFSGVFNANGFADTAVVATAIFSGVFDADGSSEGLFAASSVAGGIFNADGAATSNWRTSTVLSGVFEANVSEGGGSSEYPDGLLRLRPDGRIESVNANVGALPPGALRITTVS